MNNREIASTWLTRSLAEAIASAPEGVLAPVSELARKFGVSQKRVLESLRTLRNEGKVEFSRGSAIRRPLPKPDTESLLWISSESRLRAALTDDILSGSRRTGSVLPPATRLAGERGLSNKTVLATYRQLVSDGLVKKQGRCFMVHSKTIGRSRSIAASPPAILVLEQDLSVLGDLSSNTWSAPFSAAFFHEVGQYGVQLVPVLAIEGDSGSGSSAGLSRGRRGIDDLVSSLGSRYLGALVLGQSWTYYINDPAGRHDFTPWIELLSSYGKPVVWWDACAEIEAGFSTDFLQAYRKMFQRPAVQKHFHRCCPDLRSSVRTAVDSLVGAGHRHIAVVGGPYAGDDWARWRTEHILETLSSCRQTCHALVPHKSTMFSNAEREQMESIGVYSSRPGQSAFRSSRRRRDRLVEEALQARCNLAKKLLRFLTEAPTVTALICLNDATARMVGHGLELMRIRVPLDLSLVSFDGDFARLLPFNFSSVSPGFAQLGYQAFHLIHGNMARQELGRTDIRSPGILTHSGSIGRPGSRRTEGARFHGH